MTYRNSAKANQNCKISQMITVADSVCFICEIGFASTSIPRTKKLIWIKYNPISIYDLFISSFSTLLRNAAIIIESGSYLATDYEPKQRLFPLLSS